MSKPKSQGGLGLRDPEIAGLLAGAKIWWHWLTHSHEPWDKLWVDKYAPHWDCQDLIRFSDEKASSHIWKTAWAGHSIIQQHGFWEICDGQYTCFWEDACQQIPPLEHSGQYPKLQEAYINKKLCKVADL